LIFTSVRVTPAISLHTFLLLYDVHFLGWCAFCTRWLLVACFSSSRVQEELEKKASPEFALLHKLMRTDDVGLRERILGHYLKPQREILMPDTTVIPLDTPKPSRVAPMAFSGAVQQLVTTLRSLDVNGDTVVETIESAREVAKEARRIIEADELYGPEVLDEFTESLMGTFGGGRG